MPKLLYAEKEYYTLMLFRYIVAIAAKILLVSLRVEYAKNKRRYIFILLFRYIKIDNKLLNSNILLYNFRNKD